MKQPIEYWSKRQVYSILANDIHDINAITNITTPPVTQILGVCGYANWACECGYKSYIML